MNAVHPAFASALANICPYAKPTTPSCPDNLTEYIHQSDLGELVCWVNFEPAEADTNSPVVCNLRNVWLSDIDITRRLEKWAFKQIEDAAFAEFTHPTHDD